MIQKLAVEEFLGNSNLVELMRNNSFAFEHFLESYINTFKSNKELMESLIADTSTIDLIRDTPKLRSIFNKNRIRILKPGNVSWTVPYDWPTDFIHVQLVGGGKGTNCGEYTQGIIAVTRGQIITGSLGRGEDTHFGNLVAVAGGGAVQSGAFLVKATDGAPGSGVSGHIGGSGGFEGGPGGKGGDGPKSLAGGAGGTGDGTLGYCEDTGGTATGGTLTGSRFPGEGICGGGVGGVSTCSSSNKNLAAGGGGGGGYGGGMGGDREGTSYEPPQRTSSSGAIIITCPDGYIPNYVCYNHLGWIRDENIFNDFGV